MVEGQTNPAAEIPILLTPLSTLLVSPILLYFQNQDGDHEQTEMMTRPKILIKRHPYWRLFLYNYVSFVMTAFHLKCCLARQLILFLFFQILGIVKAFCSWTRNQARQQGPQLFRLVLLFYKKLTRPCHPIKCSGINLF